MKVQKSTEIIFAGRAENICIVRYHNDVQPDAPCCGVLSIECIGIAGKIKETLINLPYSKTL